MIVISNCSGFQRGKLGLEQRVGSEIFIFLKIFIYLFG